jgi:hypothetical protein
MLNGKLIVCEGEDPIFVEADMIKTYKLDDLYVLDYSSTTVRTSLSEEIDDYLKEKSASNDILILVKKNEFLKLSDDIEKLTKADKGVIVFLITTETIVHSIEFEFSELIHGYHDYFGVGAGTFNVVVTTSAKFGYKLLINEFAFKDTVQTTVVADALIAKLNRGDNLVVNVVEPTLADAPGCRYSYLGMLSTLQDDVIKLKKHGVNVVLLIEAEDTDSQLRKGVQSYLREADVVMVEKPNDRMFDLVSPATEYGIKYERHTILVKDKVGTNNITVIFDKERNRVASKLSKFDVIRFNHSFGMKSPLTGVVTLDLAPHSYISLETAAKIFDTMPEMARALELTYELLNMQLANPNEELLPEGVFDYLTRNGLLDMGVLPSSGKLPTSKILSFDL